MYPIKVRHISCASLVVFCLASRPWHTLFTANSRDWQGILFFLSHGSLWKPFTSKIGQLLSVSAAVVGGMFAFTYLPQLAVLVFTSGPFAVVSTVLLVLNESSTIINIISRNWILQQAILDTFDGTLISRNSTNLVRGGREVKSGSDPISRLGKTLKSPFAKFSPTALIRYVMYLPLNFVPVVGTAAFLYLQGICRLPHEVPRKVTWHLTATYSS